MATVALDTLRELYEVYPVVYLIGVSSPGTQRAGLRDIFPPGRSAAICWVSLPGGLQRDSSRPGNRTGARRDRANGRAAEGVSRRGDPEVTPTVDLHHHVIPDFYWEASNEDGSAAGGITPPRWSLVARSRTSTRLGSTWRCRRSARPGCTSVTMLRHGTLAREVNEYLADIKHDRPDRFGGFAALPLPDVDGSLDQIAYAFDVLELDGVSIFTNAGGSYLGDSRFDPIFEELQRARGSRVRPSRSVTRSDRAYPRTPQPESELVTAGPFLGRRRDRRAQAPLQRASIAARRVVAP